MSTTSSTLRWPKRLAQGWRSLRVAARGSGLRIGRGGKALISGAAICVLVAGCASGAGAGGSEGSAESGAKQIVFFGLDRAICPCLDLMYAGVDDEAEKLGVDVKYVLSGLDQSAQVQQIQQFIDSGQKPDGFMVMALNPKVVSASVKSLTAVAPVVQVQIEPEKEDFEFISAFAGLNPEAIGEVMGQALVKVREDVKASGKQLHSPEGNLLVVGAMPNYPEYERRQAAAYAQFEDQPFNIIRELRVEDNATQGTYEMVTQVLPQIKNEGIDFVLSNNGDQTAGVIKAFEQAGIEPGKDVTIVSGDCSTSGYGVEDQRTGKVAAQAVLSHDASGHIWVQTILQVIAAGKSTPGSTIAPVSPEGPPPVDLEEAPSQITSPPVVAVSGVDELDSVKIWGKSVEELCPM